MSEHLDYADLDAMVMDLNVYDVDQGGWEHEDKGLEFNLNHTLKELVRAERKDFFEPEVVRKELAPDAMQYALRIARWTGFKRELVYPKSDLETAVGTHAKLMRTGSNRVSAYAVSEIMLADYTHKLDHVTERDEALQSKFTRLPKVSQALMLFALDSAYELHFRPRKVFTDRLSTLRERFGIPQPNKV